MSNENKPWPQKIRITLAELIALPDYDRRSELSTIIYGGSCRLLESEEVSSAIGSSGASGFGIDTVDFTEEDIEIHESEIHVNFSFTMEGKADNAYSSGDVTLDGTATAVIDVDGGLSFVDIAVADDSDSEASESDDYDE